MGDKACHQLWYLLFFKEANTIQAGKFPLLPYKEIMSCSNLSKNLVSNMNSGTCTITRKFMLSKNKNKKNPHSILTDFNHSNIEYITMKLNNTQLKLNIFLLCRFFLIAQIVLNATYFKNLIRSRKQNSLFLRPTRMPK